jgi:aminoglycoside/choline kinase family phosphotransferase
MTVSSPSPVTWPDAARRLAFERWLAGFAAQRGLDAASLEPASADASFRRYLRLRGGSAGSVIVMDAPPALEDVRPFVRVAALLQQAGVRVPAVLEADVEQGFLLLEDMGRTVYLDALRSAAPDEADRLIRAALSSLVRLQRHVPAQGLPPFDADTLARELAPFPEWCVRREFGIEWSDAQHASWQRVVRLLIDDALSQPQVAVHADWMPRNLMVVEGGPGVLDFQDAVRGPITYDLASLLRDAFVSWPEEQEIDWAVRYWQQARKDGVLTAEVSEPLHADFGEFWRALEWMGLLRHLRVMGIFCRLKHRDGKPVYAQDLPRFFAYAHKVAMRYAPLAPLRPLLEPMSGQHTHAAFTF